MHVHSFRRWLAVTVTAAAAGCQTYEPRPLDLPGHVAAWSQRAPESETVRAFAERLAAADASETTTFDPADGLTLDEATLVALVYNADLRVERLRAGVSAASAGHAGRWDDPEAFTERVGPLVVPGAGHFLQWERADVLNPLAAAWFADLRH